jgi:hypothetical protein
MDVVDRTIGSWWVSVLHLVSLLHFFQACFIMVRLEGAEEGLSFAPLRTGSTFISVYFKGDASLFKYCVFCLLVLQQ